MLKKANAIAIGLLALGIVSCSTPYTVSNVAYQSVLNARADLANAIPESAVIATSYSITPEGNLIVTVRNLTDETLIIDKTKSFFVNSDGTSISYYDPTVHTTTVTDLNSGTKGASVNLGAVAGALGVGGVVGGILNGVNVGGSSTNGQSVANTQYDVDLPKVSIGPHGSITLNKQYHVLGLGGKDMSSATTIADTNIAPRNSYANFGVSLTYSLDNEVSWNIFSSELYANSRIVVPVRAEGKRYLVNEALRRVYSSKPNALAEPWFMIYFNNNLEGSQNNSYVFGSGLYDYQ